MLGIIEQRPQAVADEGVVTLALFSAPMSGAVIERLADIPAGSRRDNEPGHAAGPSGCGSRSMASR